MNYVFNKEMHQSLGKIRPILHLKYLLKCKGKKRLMILADKLQRELSSTFQPKGPVPIGSLYVLYIKKILIQ